VDLSSALLVTVDQVEITNVMSYMNASLVSFDVLFGADFDPSAMAITSNAVLETTLDAQLMDSSSNINRGILTYSDAPDSVSAASSSTSLSSITMVATSVVISWMMLWK